MRDQLRVVRVIAQVGLAEFRAANPLRIRIGAMWPRAFIQSVFFVFVARSYQGHAGEEYAVLGIPVVVMTLYTCTSVSDVPMADKIHGTGSRVRLGRVPISLVQLIRAAPWAAEGVLVAALCLIAVILVFRPHTLSVGSVVVTIVLLPLLACTSSVAGLAVANLAIATRSDVLFGNALAVVQIVATGAVVSTSGVSVLEKLGSILPMTHALELIHSLPSGTVHWNLLGAEVAVGGAWLFAFMVITRFQSRRAATTGSDSLA